MREEACLTGRCPKCGEELRVPERLKGFSCMFCGAKLSPGDLRAPAALEGDPEKLTARVRENLAGCVTGWPGLQKKIVRKEFEPAFADYERKSRGVFDDLDLACRLDPAGKTARIEAVVDDFLDKLDASWTERGPTKAKYNAARDGDKMIVAIFLAPMVERLKLSISDEFRQTLQTRWVARWPNAPFYLGSYESIVDGFRWRLCYITTAVCREEGKDDNCEELAAFRAFRDGYLRAQPDGEALIAEYYDLAPALVTCLDLCGGREVYREVRERWLAPCYRDIQAGRNASCKARYVDMVRSLEKKYLA